MSMSDEYNKENENIIPETIIPETIVPETVVSETTFKTMPTITEIRQPEEKPPIVFTETIRNESSHKKKSSFKQNIAIACIVSIVGGLSLGLGVSVGSTVTGQFLLPLMRGENLTSAGNREEIEFSFNQTDEIGNINSNNAAIGRNKGYSGNYGEGYAQIVNNVEPCVVGVTSIVQGAQNFFNMPTQQTGAGSGIIFYEDGQKVYIVTNYHVVGGASAVNVSVQGKDAIPASLVGRQPTADLAVISVLKSDLALVGINNVNVASFGDSDNMQVGDVVLAIGNALGEGNTATQGIISAVNKKINVESKDLTVIQTDAAINPGNSGGPLVNMYGEIIGINTAKLSESSVEGTGYSITSNSVKPVIEQLINSTAKPFLGIQGVDISADMAKNYNLSIGVFVDSVIKGSSAEKCGLKRTDIIVGFNGQPVFSMEHLSGFIQSCNIGDEVEIKIIRDGKTPMTIKASLSEFTDTNF